MGFTAPCRRDLSDDFGAVFISHLKKTFCMSITTLELKQKSKTNLSPCEYDITVLRVERARNPYVIIEYAVNIEDHPDDTNYLVVPTKDYDQKEKSFRDYAENHSFFAANLEDSILWLTACHFLWMQDFITAANDDIK